MATPAVTLTAKLEDFIGGAVGSVANPAKMCVALCGFGPQLPRIAGTAMIARPGPIYIESIDGNISTPLWGNDVIIPPNTYYTVSLLDGQGNVVQCAAYQFTGAGSFDLSTFPPILHPGQGTLSPQGLQTWSHNITLAEGPGTVYTLPSTPFPGAPFLFFRSGLLLNQGTPPFGRYTLSGNTITFTDSGTEVGDTLYALYWSFS